MMEGRSGRHVLGPRAPQARLWRPPLLLLLVQAARGAAHQRIKTSGLDVQHAGGAATAAINTADAAAAEALVRVGNGIMNSLEGEERAWPLVRGVATGFPPRRPGSSRRTVDVRDFEAKADNATDCTAAIAKPLQARRAGRTTGLLSCGPLDFV